MFKKFLKTLGVVAVIGSVFMVSTSHGSQGSLLRFFQDIKLPSQKVLEVDVFTNPLAQNTTRNLLSNAGPTSAAATVVSTFAAQPDYPRNLILTPEMNGASTDLGSCYVTVNGTDARGQAMSEGFQVVAASASAITGNFAFKTITSVSFPANCEQGGFSVKWNLGIGVKLGLKSCVANPGDLAWDESGGVFNATRATMATGGSTSVRASTIQFNGTLAGAGTWKAVYFQNYACP